MFDNFSHRKPSPVDPTGKFPRAFPFIGYLLNFVIEIRSFDILDDFLEILPIL